MTESTNQSGPRTTWDVIEDTCASRFTGQLTLVTHEETTNVYMTRGLIYLAEREEGAPIGERLATAGYIPPELLHGDGPDSPRLAELHALFAGEPDSSRAGVEAAIQAETEETLVDISPKEVVSFTSTMYRHHPSGIDRWFSSQQARGAAPATTAVTAPPTETSTGHGCDVQIARDEEPIEPAPAPKLIPRLVPNVQPENVTEDVADAVRRAVAAIESATKTIGPAPKGFVRSSR